MPESRPGLEREDVLALAWSLRVAPQLRVNPSFARHMERRMRWYCAEKRLRNGGKKRLFSLLWHRQHFAVWFSYLQAAGIRAVCHFLSRVTPSARLEKKDQLPLLGEQVPRALNGTLTLHANGTATIRLTGKNLQPGARLLIDDQLLTIPSTLQDGQWLFPLPDWERKVRPHSLGIRNPDGTAVQIAALLLTAAHKDGNGNGLERIPTPHHLPLESQ
ncbi:MAG TPA: hypothetical protein VN729_00845 [Ktedonobacteraceae bacterium]|nr:hypothetical protein [Ktedonobacteraceae bacterium]